MGRRRMNDMCRDELSRKDCGWLVRGGSAELLWQFTVAIKSDPVEPGASPYL